MKINIKGVRERFGLTQEEFAKQLNVSFSYVRQVESGHREPSLSLIDHIAKVFDISIHDILDDD